MEKTIITPLPKKNNSSSPYDFRPISILCPTSKILERIVFSHISKFLETNHSIPNCQHGFRKNKSVVTQLIETNDDLSKAHKQKFSTDIIYFDLAKAFDKIPHARLISKLSSLGISGNILNWLKYYLSNRSYSVKVNTSYSKEYSIPNGVPQGTVGGPTLFIAYIADIIDFCNTEGVTIKLFADDLKIYFSSNSPINFNLPLQNFIYKFINYCNLNGLQIAATKCHVLHLGNKNPKLQYLLSNFVIPSFDSK